MLCGIIDILNKAMPRQDKRFDEMVNYMKESTRSQALNTKNQVDGDEVTGCTGGCFLIKGG